MSRVQDMELKEKAKLAGKTTTITSHCVNKATEIKNVPFSLLGPAPFGAKDFKTRKDRDLTSGQLSIAVLGYAQSRSIHTMGQSHTNGDWLQAEEYKVICQLSVTVSDNSALLLVRSRG